MTGAGTQRAPAQPPQAELHRHLDIAVRPATLLEFLQAQGRVPHSTSLAQFVSDTQVTKPLGNLREVLARMEIFQHAYASPSNCERIAFEAAEDCVHEGTQYVEFRFAPAFVAEHTGLGWDDLLGSFEQGLRRAETCYPGFQSRLIVTAVRDYPVDGPLGAHATLEWAARVRHRIAGIDLAGNEDRHPCRKFGAAFAQARRDGLTEITIHAGESAPAHNIWEAIEELGARRIGHGLSAIQDAALVDYLVQHRIHVEACPTSNWVTRGVPSLAEHPLAELLRRGVSVSLNTDDPGLFATTVRLEFDRAESALSLSDQELTALKRHAWESRFEAPKSTAQKK